MMLNENLKRLRQEKGLSQEGVAERLGVTRQAAAKWETGATVPDIENLIVLSALYGVTLDELVKGAEPCAVKAIRGSGAARDALIAFLLRACVATYAGKGPEDATPSRPGSHDLRYAEGDLLYVDTYVGGQRFSGEEAVFERGAACWAMNYSGRVLSERFSGDFLKAALKLRPADAPFRGPKLYRDGRFAYHSDVAGDFEWFQGKEEIFRDEEKVYECVYHGGLARA